MWEKSAFQSRLFCVSRCLLPTMALQRSNACVPSAAGPMRCFAMRGQSDLLSWLPQRTWRPMLVSFNMIWHFGQFVLFSSSAVHPNIILYNSEDSEEYCRYKCSKIIWGKVGFLCFCLPQSTSKWQIIMCLCQEGLTTTTMPMWNSFWTLLNVYQFRYHRTLNWFVVFPQ